MHFLTFDRDRELFLTEMKWRRKFVVNGIVTTIMKEEVKALFTPSGAVEEVELPEKITGSSFTYAVVTMSDNEGADRIREDLLDGELPIGGGIRLRVSQAELRRQKKVREKKKKFIPRFCPQVWIYCGDYARADIVAFRDTDNIFPSSPLPLTLLKCKKPKELSDEVIDWFMLATARFGIENGNSNSRGTQMPRIHLIQTEWTSAYANSSRS